MYGQEMRSNAAILYIFIFYTKYIQYGIEWYKKHTISISCRSQVFLWCYSNYQGLVTTSFVMSKSSLPTVRVTNWLIVECTNAETSRIQQTKATLSELPTQLLPRITTSWRNITAPWTAISDSSYQPAKTYTTLSLIYNIAFFSPRGQTEGWTIVTTNHINSCIT